MPDGAVQLRWYPEAPRGGRPVVAIGTFDGVHLGHQAILRAAVEMARALGEPCVALTFDPPPRQVLQPDTAPPQLTTLQQRLELLLQQGVNACAVVLFDRQVAGLLPEQFVDGVLVEKLRAGAVVAGYNFGFGRGRQGTVRTLEELGQRRGFRVRVVGPVSVDGRPVSSTLARALVQAGQVQQARAVLGRPFTVRGVVVPGAGRGRSLGYPTANVATEPGQLLPGDGVYIARARLLGADPAWSAKPLAALAVISARPTFGAGQERWLEVHALFEAGDWYRQAMEVEFLEFLRGIRTFASPQELLAQIEEDRRRAVRYFEELDRQGSPAEESPRAEAGLAPG